MMTLTDEQLTTSHKNSWAEATVREFKLTASKPPRRDRRGRRSGLVFDVGRIQPSYPLTIDENTGVVTDTTPVVQVLRSGYVLVWIKDEWSVADRTLVRLAPTMAEFNVESGPKRTALRATNELFVRYVKKFEEGKIPLNQCGEDANENKDTLIPEKEPAEILPPENVDTFNVDDSDNEGRDDRKIVGPGRQSSGKKRPVPDEDIPDQDPTDLIKIILDSKRP